MYQNFPSPHHTCIHQANHKIDLSLIKRQRLLYNPIMSTEEKEPAVDKEEEDEEEDLEKLQAEIARMEAEAARIAQETEDLDKSSSAGAASTSSAADAKKSDAADTASKDGWEMMSYINVDVCFTTLLVILVFFYTTN